MYVWPEEWCGKLPSSRIFAGETTNKTHIYWPQKGSLQQSKVTTVPKSDLLKQWLFTGVTNRSMGRAQFTASRATSKAAISPKPFSSQAMFTKGCLTVWESLLSEARFPGLQTQQLFTPYTASEALINIPILCSCRHLSAHKTSWSLLDRVFQLEEATIQKQVVHMCLY